MTGHMPKSLSRLPAEWLAHRYDPGQDAVHFIAVDRAQRRSAPFLTDENLPQAAAPTVLRREDCLALAPPPAPLHFIFHSAYCCSTLLANALDREGLASSLKEPTLLNDLVGWRQRGAPAQRLAEVLDGALRLLARPLASGEAVVAKPSNVVNALAPAMLTIRPEAGCLLLYAPLRLYLGSIAAKGLWGRLWVRDLLAKQLKDGLVDLGFEPADHFLQSDLQVAAVGWLAQHRLFAHLAERWPARVRTLDSETLLARPAEALAAIGALFGLRWEAPAIQETVDLVFTRHAKFGGTFSRSDRSESQQAAAEAHADELEKVHAWALAVAETNGLSLACPSPLLRPA
jgi:hypothetical protein